MRLLAVSALMEGRDRAEVAALLKVSARAVDNWWVKWPAGRGALLPRPGGRRVGEHQVLSEAEQAAVRQAALAPCVIKMGFSAWLRNGSVKYLTALNRIVIEWLSSMSRWGAIEKFARIN
ncbi:helix-turn-helix domain-containing protein [Streptomyces sp. NPDC057963]|uniref:helix-turn-helix domain-containing protein n=1 Tax=Streptomyces sp. NPDC057963 TaxID=3346290 RepID=UPI0036E30983